MRKTHKIINIVLIFMLIGEFLCPNLSYSFSASSYSLRVPLISQDSELQNREKTLLINLEAEKRDPNWSRSKEGYDEIRRSDNPNKQITRFYPVSIEIGEGVVRAYITKLIESHEEFIVVTSLEAAEQMKDWNFPHKDELLKHAIYVDKVHYKDVMRFYNEAKEKCNKPQRIIGIGMGSVTDWAKIMEWKLDTEIDIIPSAMSTNAMFTSNVSIRASEGTNLEVGTWNVGAPRQVIIDLDFVQLNKRGNISGAGDLFSGWVALKDWDLVVKKHKEREDKDIYKKAHSVLEKLNEHASDIKENNKNGVRALAELARDVSKLMDDFRSGRPKAGSEHRLSDAIENETQGRRILHGEQVAVATILMGYFHGLDYKELYKMAEALGLPLSLDEIGLTKQDLINALVKVRPREGRFSYFDVNHITEDKAREVVEEIFERHPIVKDLTITLPLTLGQAEEEMIAQLNKKGVKNVRKLEHPPSRGYWFVGDAPVKGLVEDEWEMITLLIKTEDRDVIEYSKRSTPFPTIELRYSADSGKFIINGGVHRVAAANIKDGKFIAAKIEYGTEGSLEALCGLEPLRNGRALKKQEIVEALGGFPVHIIERDLAFLISAGIMEKEGTGEDIKYKPLQGILDDKNLLNEIFVYKDRLKIEDIRLKVEERMPKKLAFNQAIQLVRQEANVLMRNMSPIMANVKNMIENLKTNLKPEEKLSEDTRNALEVLDKEVMKANILIKELERRVDMRSDIYNMCMLFYHYIGNDFGGIAMIARNAVDHGRLTKEDIENMDKGVLTMETVIAGFLLLSDDRMEYVLRNYGKSNNYPIGMFSSKEEILHLQKTLNSSPYLTLSEKLNRIAPLTETSTQKPMGLNISPDSERVMYFRDKLYEYYGRLNNSIQIPDLPSVEEKILFILLHPKIRNCTLAQMGYKIQNGRYVRLDNNPVNHLEEIRYFTSRKLPIEAMISGYFCKGRNPTRCYQQSFDLSEIAGLCRLNLICELIKSVYPQGAKFTIIADGIQSADIFFDNVQLADEYQNTIKQLIGILSFQDIISIIDLDEILPPEFKDEYNRWLTYYNDVGNLKDPVSQRIITTSIHAVDWSGYSPEEVQRILHDGALMYPQRFQDAKNRAVRYLAMQRAVRELDIYKKAYPSKLRLTFHPKPGQISIYLTSPESRICPWLGVCGLRLDGTPVIRYRSYYENNPEWVPVYYDKGDHYPAYFEQVNSEEKMSIVDICIASSI